MMPNGPMKITGLPIDLCLYESEHKIEDEELKVSYAASMVLAMWVWQD